MFTVLLLDLLASVGEQRSVLNSSSPLQTELVLLLLCPGLQTFQKVTDASSTFSISVLLETTLECTSIRGSEASIRALLHAHIQHCMVMRGGSSGSERLLFWHGSANVARSAIYAIHRPSIQRLPGLLKPCRVGRI